MKDYLVIFSDTHANFKFGLLNPNSVLYDEGPDGELEAYSPSLNKSQERLWSWYQEDIAFVNDLSKGGRLFVLHNGDPTDGDKYKDQKISSRQADQITMATDNMTPWFSLPQLDTFTLIQGTASHEFGEGTSSSLVGEMLRREFPKVNVDVLMHIWATIDLIDIDVAHHGPSTGIRNWTKGNMVYHYTKSIMMDHLVNGEKVPDLVLRSHFHEYKAQPVWLRTRGKTHKTLGIVTPSYSWMSYFAKQATRSAYQTSVGLLVFEIEDGVIVNMHERVRETDIRTRRIYNDN